MDRSNPQDSDGPARSRSSGFGVPSERATDQSDADQRSADADRAASADDQVASTADHLAAREDQLASDRDQAAADEHHAASSTHTPDEQRAYEVARNDREAITVTRRASNFRREQTARLRRVTAALRDRISRPRMRSSAIRKRLISEGETPEMAVRWCDAWELAAEGQGVPEDDNYWNRATQWIWTERAAGRTP
jgi:outer membrane murein-binding lipoprotein Lpp